jgi:hypothetical protein
MTHPLCHGQVRFGDPRLCHDRRYKTWVAGSNPDCIRGGRQDFSSASCPDLIPAPTQSPEFAGIAGSALTRVLGRPAMTMGEALLRTRQFSNDHLIRMSMGSCPDGATVMKPEGAAWMR